MNQEELQQTAALLREAAQILADISVQHPEATEVSTWRWPIIDELLGSAAAFEEELI